MTTTPQEAGGHAAAREVRETIERITAPRCPDCDRPLATAAHRREDDTPRPEDDLLCWRAFNGRCYGDPIDWRARAIAAERQSRAAFVMFAAVMAERDRLAADLAAAEHRATAAEAYVERWRGTAEHVARQRDEALAAHEDAQGMLEEVATERDDLIAWQAETEHALKGLARALAAADEEHDRMRAEIEQHPAATAVAIERAIADHERDLATSEPYAVRRWAELTTALDKATRKLKGRAAAISALRQRVMTAEMIGLAYVYHLADAAREIEDVAQSPPGLFVAGRLARIAERTRALVCQALTESGTTEST